MAQTQPNNPPWDEWSIRKNWTCELQSKPLLNYSALYQSNVLAKNIYLLYLFSASQAITTEANAEWHATPTRQNISRNALKTFALGGIGLDRQHKMAGNLLHHLVLAGNQPAPQHILGEGRVKWLHFHIGLLLHSCEWSKKAKTTTTTNRVKIEWNKSFHRLRPQDDFAFKYLRLQL